MSERSSESSAGIDIVIPWVDPADDEWDRAYREHRTPDLGEEAAGANRYRDLGLLRYSFRSFEKFTPWVRKIHLVTCGHWPGWLNQEHPKLHLVSHRDLFPEEQLPLFSSPPIEMGLKNIEGLSERFVYFNDDTFMLRQTEETRFFAGELPRDFLQVGVLFHDGLFSHAAHEAMTLLNQHFRRGDLLRGPMFFKTLSPHYGLVRNLRTILTLLVSRSVSRFLEYHHPQAHLKQNLEEVCQNFPEQVQRTIDRRFKSSRSIGQYIYRYWGLIHGRFSPYQPRDVLYRTVRSSADVDAALPEVDDDLRFLCLNDSRGMTSDEFGYMRDALRGILEARLPEKSAFEAESGLSS